MESLELPERSRGRGEGREGRLYSGDIVEESPHREQPQVDFRVRAFTENPSGLRQRGPEAPGRPERLEPSRLSGELHPREVREGPGVLQTVAAQIRGFYLIKFAVSVTACYLTIQLLITFSEVLLPFIFALLVMIVLEPVKKYVMRVLCRLAVRIFLALRMDFCVDGVQVAGHRHPSIDSMEGQVYAGIPEDEDLPGSGGSRVTMPVPAIKRLLVAVSIFYCLAMTGRVFWLVAKIFFRAAAGISADMEHYKEGAARLKSWIKKYITGLHIESLDFHKVLEELVVEVESVGSVLTQSLLAVMLQAVVTFIFLIYMLWSPVKVDGSAMATEVFNSTSRYLKVKFLVSSFTGLSISLLLYGTGLNCPDAFGLLALLCNFLPGIGSPVASIMPCLLAMIDARKSPTQVAIAFVLQIIVHFVIDFMIEPVVFGFSVEIHSVIVILGIWFFYQVWGVPGMLLSVPLLAAIRMMIKSVKFPTSGGDDNTDAFFDSVFRGRWMSTVGEQRGEEVIDESEVHAAGQKEEEAVEAETVFCGKLHQYEDLWTMFSESQLAQDVRQMYHQRQLTCDLGLLICITVGLSVLQV
ncbi:AI-2 transport protein TqsA (Transport of quorum-sensing signal protein) [Durusdinium trenchii]|uniref:AI-2 transport protein TqsA (Transport of quorum-sensing signal protein) n=1 Tax=Durusdinium trenchii TaxID=1381693 RepID=A0ABP0SNN7_9DINO